MSNSKVGGRSFLPAGLVLLAILLLTTCMAVAPTRSAPATTSTEPAPVVEVPVTVEVTRIVVTERIVPATPAPPAICPGPSLANGDEIVVASLMPLADPATLSGAMATQAALSIAAREINDAGGIAGLPVRVWSADVDVERAGQVVEEAVHRQCAAAILVAADATITSAVLGAAEAEGVPLFVLDAVDDELTAGGSDVVFRLAPSATMLASMYGEWLSAVGDYNGDGVLSAVLVAEDTPRASQNADAIAAELTRLGITSEIFRVSPGSDEFSSLIARIAVRETLPDAILIRLNGDAALTLQRQLADNGIGPHKHSLIVTTRRALSDEQFWQQMGDQGVYTVVQRAGPWNSTLGTGGADFASLYSALMGRWPEAPAFAAHDALLLVASAVESAKSLSSSEIIAALESVDLNLAGGRYTFPYGAHSPPSESGAAPWMWRQWLDAPLLFLQYTTPNQSAQDMAVIWPPQYSTSETPVTWPTPLASD